jgi:metal-responsive CopG/Arc/MetJ family transcriptional regulator
MKQQKRSKKKVAFKLDLVEDAELVEWLESHPRGTRSQAIRQALRRGIGLEEPEQQAGADLRAIRDVVADELARALNGLHVSSRHQRGDEAEQGYEDRYGSKLDRMMGGFLGDEGGDQ